MPQSISEKKRICFQALGLTEKEAGNILLAELVRLENDERLPDIKGISIQVANDEQRRLLETILLLYKGENNGFATVLDVPQNVKIKVGTNENGQENSNNIINLNNFDYQKEKEKLVNRLNSSILGNLDIRDILEQQGTENNTLNNSKYESEIKEIEQQIKHVQDKIVGDQFSFFSMFKQGSIAKGQIELNQLKKDLKAKKEEYESETSFKKFSEKRRLTRIKTLSEKGKKLEGIKFLFTGKKERVITSRDEKGRIRRTFVETDTEEPFVEKQK